MDAVVIDTAAAPRRHSVVLAGARDRILLAVVVLVAGLVGWYAASLASGAIPAENALFDADTGRVLSNLTGSADNYYRFKVHPWQGWICIFYQQILARLMPPQIGVPLISVMIAASCAGLLFVVLRRLAVGPWAAMSYALAFCSTATYVFWSTVPETHMAGGVSTLVAVLLLTGDGRGRAGRPTWHSIAGLAVAFSMVVTNAMVWVLNKIDFDPLQRGWRAFVAANWANRGDAIRQAAWSTALVFLVWAPQWLFLRKRIGIPFNFLEERHYIEVGSRSWNWSLHVLGVLPPGPIAGIILSIAGVGVLIAALRILEPKLWFVPLFPLFGVVLHAFYGSDSSFLFAPNYMPLFVVSLALVAARTLPKWFPAILVPVAAVLLLFNLQAWRGDLASIAKAGQMKTYESAVHY